MYYGIDVGRWGLKNVGPGIDEVTVFPSFVAPYRELDIETGRGNMLDHLVVTINGKRYFMGELARREGGSREFQKEKANHRNTIPLLVTAVALSSPEQYISPKIVFGLPISDYRKQARSFEKTAAGNYQVEIKNKNIIIELHNSNLLSFPEGAGVLWDQILNEYGNIKNDNFANMTLAVLDIGWKTCNFAVLRGLQYDDSLSGTLPMGLSRAFKMFYKRISRDYDYTPGQAENLLVNKGQIELQRLAQEIKDNISMWWPEAVISEFDKLFIAGGGGLSMFNILDYENKEKVFDSQISNARGFFKVAKAQMSK